MCACKVQDSWPVTQAGQMRTQASTNAPNLALGVAPPGPVVGVLAVKLSNTRPPQRISMSLDGCTDLLAGLKVLVILALECAAHVEAT